MGTLVSESTTFASCFRKRTEEMAPRFAVVSRNPLVRSSSYRTRIWNTTPQDYSKLLEPILDGCADVVYGSRFLGGPKRVHYFWHYVGNELLTLLSNMVTNLNLSDMERGSGRHSGEIQSLRV